MFRVVDLPSGAGHGGEGRPHARMRSPSAKIITKIAKLFRQDARALVRLA
jgi:hypothetical protein